MFYEYSLYGPSKKALTQVVELAVGGLEFDPRNVTVRAAYLGPKERVQRFLRRMLLVPDIHDFHVFVTGPADATTRVQLDGLLEKHRCYTDGGGFSFDYDPTGYYSDVQLMRMERVWLEERAADEERMRMEMTPEERERYDRDVAEFLASDACQTFAWGDDSND